MIIKGIDKKAISQVCLFRFTKHKRPIAKKRIRNKKAFGIEISPEAMGLFFVLEIFLSIFLSQRSLIIHPAERKANAPIKKIKYKNKIFCNLISDRGNVQRHGSKSNQLPIGLSNLASLIHLWTLCGRMSHHPFLGMSEYFNFIMLKKMQNHINVKLIIFNLFYGSNL